MFSTNKYYIGILNLYISLLLHLVSESYLYDLKFKYFLCFGFRQFISLSVNSYLIIDIMNVSRCASSTISDHGWLNFYCGNCWSTFFFICSVILVHWPVRFFNYKFSIKKFEYLILFKFDCCPYFFSLSNAIALAWLNFEIQFNNSVNN